MSKNLTRNDIKDLLKAQSQKAAKMIEDSHCIVPKDWITTHSYIKEGADKTDYHCQCCGEVFTLDGRPNSWYYRSYKSATKCPTCGNTNITTSDTVHENEMHIYVKETEDGAEFAKFSIAYYFDDCDENPNWYLRTPRLSLRLGFYGMFHKELGWFVYGVHDDKLFKRDSQNEIDCLAFVKRATPINNADLTKWTDILKQAEEFEDMRNIAKEHKKKNSKSKLLDDMRAGYKAKQIEDEMLTGNSKGFLYKIYSQDGENTSYIACCIGCGHTDIIDSKATSYTCPVCGNKHEGSFSYYSSRQSVSEAVAVYEKTNLPENDMLLRLFRIDWSFDIDSGLTKKIREKQRIFFGKKVVVYDADTKKSEWIKATIRDISCDLNGWRLSARTCQTDEEITEIIKSSCLMYSGLAESYGMSPHYQKYEDAPSVAYLLAWYKAPNIELLLKANLTNLVEYYVKHSGEASLDGSNLAEVLGVSPAVAKMAIKTNPSYPDLRDLNNLYMYDNTITVDLLEEIKRQRLSTNSIVSLKRDYGIDYTKTMQYLQSVYDNQCIEKSDALHVWIDYLRMAHALKINLADKTRKFPGSLKKEHDVAMFAYKAVQVELDKERFASQAKINQFYEYSYKDLMVRIPMTPQDIVEEATKQRNCLRSYVERVKNGNTVVAFIRKKEDPDETYLTAEIYNGDLVQLKGYCNSNPRNKIINEFVEHWAKAKQIRVMC